MKATELQKYEYIIEQSEKRPENDAVLIPGTVVNDCILIYSKPYLSNLKLAYHGDEVDEPVVARISHNTFR